MNEVINDVFDQSIFSLKNFTLVIIIIIDLLGIKKNYKALVQCILDT